jgi:hypothetical protein
MRRAATLIGALAMVATLATGCGSSDDESDGDSGASANATAPPTTAATTTSTRPVDKPTGPELADMLLTAGEMGEGWTVVPPDAGDDDEVGCIDALEDDGTLDTTKASIEFQYGDEQAIVLEGVRWAGVEPFDTIDAVVDAIEDCPFSELAGGSNLESIEMISFPLAGDDTVAWELVYSSGGETYTAQLILALQDDILIQVMALLAGKDITTNETQPIIEGAVQKVSLVH